MQQRLPGFAEVESPITVDVIWMHLNFDGFSATTLSSINTTHISTRIILLSPAYEDGSDRGFRNVGF